MYNGELLSTVLKWKYNPATCVYVDRIMVDNNGLDLNMSLIDGCGIWKKC